MGAANSLVVLIAVFFTLLGLLVGLSRRVSRLLVQLLGVRLYVVLFWPGVIVHELSHLSGCVFTFTKVYGFHTLPLGQSGQLSVLGEVSHAKTGRIRTAIIAIAPLFGASFVLWFLSAQLAPDILSIMHEPLRWQWIARLSFWHALYFYVAIAVAVHLLPSNHDFKNAVTGSALVLLVVSIITSVAWFFVSDLFLQILQDIFEQLIKALFPVVGLLFAIQLFVATLTIVVLSTKGKRR